MQASENFVNFVTANEHKYKTFPANSDSKTLRHGLGFCCKSLFFIRFDIAREIISIMENPLLPWNDLSAAEIEAASSYIKWHGAHTQFALELQVTAVFLIFLFALQITVAQHLTSMLGFFFTE